ncbi:MAG: topoisomerase C-terminal repeat-containing protein, partial [Pseudomonadota bacterium]
AYSCEKAVGPARTCDFRSGRTILKRVITRDEMVELLENGKTPLLEKFISKKGRPFSAFLVKQPDGKIGFEFEERDPKTAKGKAAKAAKVVSSALRILGNHPDDGSPISIYSGRYGPYVKHGKTNATIQNKDKVDSITLQEALDLLAEKVGFAKPAKRKTNAKKATKKKPTKAKVAGEIGAQTAMKTTTRKRKSA